MSHGHGRIQRAILAEFDAVPKLTEWEYQRRCRLSSGVRDLRQISKTLARRMGGISHASFASEAWQASFSRATRRLVAAGNIEILSRVPVVSAAGDSSLPGSIASPSARGGDVYLRDCWTRQRRYARRVVRE